MAKEGNSSAIGLISGTSMDGIDACIVKITCSGDNEINGLAFRAATMC